MSGRGITSRARRGHTASAIWALAGASLLAAGAAEAQNAGDITVTGKRDEVSSPKYTAPILDTPQTVTVVDKKLIEEQNLLGLRDVLSTLPGITFGAGEGGGGFGDSINLRGFTASNDITVDGVRDSAQYTRSDPFNLEQIEIVNGANSVYGGAGSVGGSINLATKRPMARDGAMASAGVGTDNYQRLTLDLNKTIGEGAAFRLNLMGHRNDVPGRDVEENKRWGVAPSLTVGMGGPTQVTLLYAHQEDDNTPQYGVPFALNAFNTGPLPGVDPSDYFGYSNIDKQDGMVDSFTAIIEHRFNDTLSVRNLTRWQKATQYLVVDAPQGTFCLASGINPYTGVACTPRDSFVPSGNPRGNVRDTANDILINQSDFTAHFNTGGLAHTLVTGLSFSNETYALDGANLLRTPQGQTFILPTTTLSNPNPVYTGQQNFKPLSTTDSEVKNRALYTFDRIEIGKYWELNGGVRFERNEGLAVTTSTAYATSGAATTTINPPAENADDLFSYRTGIVFKPAESASLYVAYGNAVTPSQSTVNGGCTATSTTGTANCNLDPEEARSYELGGKWSTMDGGLLLTAALFRNERTNFRVNSGDPAVLQQQLDGSSKVDGVALGASGLITDHWSVFANYTYLNSEIEQSISTIAVSGGALDFQKGDPLPNTPKHSASFWTTYELPHRLMIGYGATYAGAYTFNRASASAALFYTPDYWVHRAMISYGISRSAVLQLNINNLFDEHYYTRIRNNATSGWATPGEARNAVLSLSYRF
jgi:catecholate siderophore receptor